MSQSTVYSNWKSVIYKAKYKSDLPLNDSGCINHYKIFENTINNNKVFADWGKFVSIISGSSGKIILNDFMKKVPVLILNMAMRSLMPVFELNLRTVSKFHP